jgi:hypothetical protein
MPYRGSLKRGHFSDMATYTLLWFPWTAFTRTWLFPSGASSDRSFPRAEPRGGAFYCAHEKLAFAHSRRAVYGPAVALV